MRHRIELYRETARAQPPRLARPSIGVTLAEAFAFGLWLTGLPFLIREVYAREKVSIVLYHRPTPQSLAAHLAYLDRHYNLIDLETLVAAIWARDWTRIPPKALVITFDDGYAENLALLPLLERYGVRPTVYLCSHLVDTRRHIWSHLNDGGARTLRLIAHDQLLAKLRQEANFSPEGEHGERVIETAAEIVHRRAQQLILAQQGRFRGRFRALHRNVTRTGIWCY